MAAPNKYKRPESVLVVIHTRDGMALMLRRADHPEFWQSVTGSMHWDEASPRDTALREVKEETGLDASNGLRDLGIAHTYTIFPEWRHRYEPGVTTNLEHVFALELDAPVDVVLEPEEHSEYRWLDISAAAELATSHTNRGALALIAARHS